ncbi:FecR family protein [Chitinophaga ginsengisegetis]|uniref:FecR family protein n=1 Tax=Chitinophaga ginsengisegetis TaxID=393003 RepID=A0A1T5P968_9BACT|nr:FecR domain-containing protein [Chitinophaga ginsengisegetis]SKD09216.1 FecR family protein [Chitinophaga ginsengisegetis]
MNYSEFDAADFAADDLFRAWVLEETGAAFWEGWITAHPEKEAALQDARALVLALRFRTNEISMEEMDAVKDQIDLLLDEPVIKKNNGTARRRWYYALAAAAAVLLFAGIWYAQGSEPPIENILVQTGFGETKTLQLPDGSIVQLNANSSVSYPRKWTKENVRAVTLNGEAYFNVSKSPAGLHPKFRVLMPQVTIEVKGTAFNVYHRHDQVKVLLEEGKIVVNDSLDMKPGDMMSFTPGAHHRLQADPVQLTAWKQHRLLFRDTPLISVAQQLEDIYGYKIQFRNKKMEGLLFTGAGPADDPSMVLKAMATVHQLKMKQSNSVIIFE